ncbi:hypothetical protein BT69DRAFT_1345951 [Atractiella rhizophila]|nr:hypothetical protein BT69DRAFT_1345951 [Atractiella rhizophila]
MVMRRSSRTRKARTFPDHVMGAQDTDEEIVLPPEEFESTEHSARKRRKSSAAVQGEGPDSQKKQKVHDEKAENAAPVSQPTVAVSNGQAARLTEIDPQLLDILDGDRSIDPVDYSTAPTVFPPHNETNAPVSNYVSDLSQLPSSSPQTNISLAEPESEAPETSLPSLDRDAWLIPRAQHPWLFDICFSALQSNPSQTLSSFSSEQMRSLNKAPAALNVEKYPKKPRDMSRRMKTVFERKIGDPIREIWDKEFLEKVFKGLSVVVEEEGRTGWEKARWEVYDAHSKLPLGGIRYLKENDEWEDRSFFWLVDNWDGHTETDEIRNLEPYQQFKGLLANK